LFDYQETVFSEGAFLPFYKTRAPVFKDFNQPLQILGCAEFDHLYVSGCYLYDLMSSKVLQKHFLITFLIFHIIYEYL
jgi:hypothetical protein